MCAVPEAARRRRFGSVRGARRWIRAALIVVASPLFAQSADDGFDPSVGDGVVFSVAIDPVDGRPLLGGSFSQIGGTPRQSLARLRIDGSIDGGFQANIGAGSDVLSIAPLASGDYLVGGALSSVSGQARGNLVKLGPFGALDTDFDPQVVGEVTAVVEDRSNPDAPRIYLGGSITSVAGASREGLARLNADGSLDTSFDPPAFIGTAYALMPLHDGGVLIGGFLALAGQSLDGRMFRLRDDGSVDPDFQVDMDAVSGQASVRSIVRQVDGNILVAGGFDTVNGLPRSRIVRMDADGMIDPDYAPVDFNAPIFSITLQPDGRAVVVGNFTATGGGDRIARLMHDGSLDESFAAVSADAQLFAAAVQDDGSVIVAGTFSGIDGVERNRAARLLPDGELEQTFLATILGGAVAAIAQQPDGRIVVAGSFDEVNGEERDRIVRLNADGSIDSSFNAATNRPVSSVAVLDDGRLLVAGDFNVVNDNQSQEGIARFEADGTLDSSFVSDLGAGSVTAMVVQPDGKIVIGVSVPPARRGAGESLMRLNADGTVDTGFTALELDGLVRAIALELAGPIVFGGEFLQVDGVGRNRIARVLEDGTLDPAYDPDANGTIWSLSTNFNGSVLVGGDFSTVGGEPRSRLARIAGSGNVINFTIGADDSVLVMLAQRGNFNFIGGAFANIGFQPRSGLALLAGNSIGAYDGAIGGGSLWSGAVQSDGKVLVGGEFVQVAGEEHTNIARLTGFSAARQTISRSVAEGLVRWDIGGSLPEVKEFPRLLISATCCDREDFEPMPGEVFFTGEDWVYQGFPELDGVFYLRFRARVGDGKGAGTGLFESPIHQFIGTGPDGIFADGFDGVP